MNQLDQPRAASAQHQKHTDPEGQQFRALGTFLTLSPDPPPQGLFRDEGHLHLQLHDQVVVGGALVDVLQGHDVLVLDPGKD